LPASHHALVGKGYFPCFVVGQKFHMDRATLAGKAKGHGGPSPLQQWHFSFILQIVEIHF
jgi:hypothetical protein